MIIPTYERRDMVARNVAALDQQTIRDFEVVVVIDGSTDGTANALRRLSLNFPLTVVEQPNAGLAQARNAGAAAARGDLLLFLDDDMEADPFLLAEHEMSHRSSADLVIGHLPLHPDSPRNLLSWGVGFWADARRDRLAGSASLPLTELLAGQLSISRDTFAGLGGFDVAFTRDGLYGGEDIDFSYRALEAQLRFVFNPDAISYQFYDVDPAEYLSRAYMSGSAEQELDVKHPGNVRGLGGSPAFHTRRSLWTLGPFVSAPALFSRPICAAAATLVRSGRRGDRLRGLFWAVRTMEHLRGARDARRRLSCGDVVVLAYHAVADLATETKLKPYGVAPERLAEHLDALRGGGWTFVDLDQVLKALDGEARPPRRAVLVTFDDAYATVFDAGIPILKARDIPAVVFAVAGHVGGTNDWDALIRNSELRLMSADELVEAARGRVEIGCHSASHHDLTRLEPAQLDSEMLTARDDLASLGLPKPRAFAYPYGEVDTAVAAAAREAGYEAAFTVKPGTVHRTAPRWTLPRIEILADDSAATVRVKARTAAWPTALRKPIWQCAERVL